jgi:hypothetical protein
MSAAEQEECSLVPYRCLKYLRQLHTLNASVQPIAEREEVIIAGETIMTVTFGFDQSVVTDQLPYSQSLGP